MFCCKTVRKRGVLVTFQDHLRTNPCVFKLIIRIFCCHMDFKRDYLMPADDYIFRILIIQKFKDHLVLLVCENVYVYSIVNLYRHKNLCLYVRMYSLYDTYTSNTSHVCSIYETFFLYFNQNTRNPPYNAMILVR